GLSRVAAGGGAALEGRAVLVTPGVVSCCGEGCAAGGAGFFWRRSNSFSLRSSSSRRDLGIVISSCARASGDNARRASRTVPETNKNCFICTRLLRLGLRRRRDPDFLPG